MPLCKGTFNHIWNMYSYNRIWEIAVQYFCVLNIVEFNVFSKSGLGIEIGQFNAEKHPISHHKLAKSRFLGRIEKIWFLNFSYFFGWFLLILIKNDQKLRILKFFDFTEKLKFCWFCDEKLDVSRHWIDRFWFQDQIWKIH
jgi:hypothetical protein